MEEQDILGRCERWVVMEEGEMKGRDGRERDLAMGEIVEVKKEQMQFPWLRILLIRHFLQLWN